MDSSMLVRHTLALVDGDLHFLELVYNVEEDERLARDPLGSDATGEHDIFVREARVKVVEKVRDAFARGRGLQSRVRVGV